MSNEIIEDKQAVLQRRVAEIDKKITFSEFKYWLQGVESMAKEGWRPTAQQWRTIREKINTISDVPQQTHTEHTRVAGNVTEAPRPKYEGPVTMAPSAMSNIQPVITSAGPPHNAALFANADAPAIPVKTPSIDTSGGRYDSSFA